MTMLRRIAMAAVVATSFSLLASCASNNLNARQRVKTEPGRYAMTVPEIKAAAQKGDADAQYALGFMYYYGKKVDRDMTLAKQWIGKAAAQGQTRAITAMKLLGDTPVVKATPQLAKKTSATPTTKPSTTVAAMRPNPRFAPQANMAKRAIRPQKTIARVTTAPTTKATTRVAQKSPQPITKRNTIAQQRTTTPTPIKPSKIAAVTPINKLNLITDKQLHSFEKWLLTKQDDHFTLQLLGSRHLDQVEKVIQENHLANKSAIYHTMYKDKAWYVLVYGDYETPDDALAAIDRLPPTAQQLKPWVKPFASVKVGIRMSSHTV